MRTRLATARVASRPVRVSTTATPVMTSCSRPRKRLSIARASSGPAGLPRASPSKTTTVSAARTTAPSTRAATARAFLNASRETASGVGPPGSVSSISLGTTSNSGQIWRRSSRLRGDADASTTLTRGDWNAVGARPGAFGDPLLLGAAGRQGHRATLATDWWVAWSRKAPGPAPIALQTAEGEGGDHDPDHPGQIHLEAQAEGDGEDAQVERGGWREPDHRTAGDEILDAAGGQQASQELAQQSSDHEADGHHQEDQPDAAGGRHGAARSGEDQGV